MPRYHAGVTAGQEVEIIEIVDYQPGWPGRYGGERDRVRIALATANLRFEHIGSTAVPGLAGRPIVDLMLGAPAATWAARDELGARIVALGYQALGEAGLPGRLAFRRRTPLRAFDLALVEADGPLWRDMLALRDYLRANPDEAAAYASARRSAGHDKAALISALVAKTR